MIKYIVTREQTLPMFTFKKFEKVIVPGILFLSIHIDCCSKFSLLESIETDGRGFYDLRQR